jgi:acetate kinase
MDGRILVLNVGSSSIKFSVFAGASLALERKGEVEAIGLAPRLRTVDAASGAARDAAVAAATHAEAIAVIHRDLASSRDDAHFAAIGHRVVHGGSAFVSPIEVDAAVLAELDALAALAPLHQPDEIAAIRAMSDLAPGVPQVACFDTAFHHRQPLVARTFGLPRAISEQGIRRYGFHGLSYEYVVAALPRVAPALAGSKIVVAHLGNGASMCAIDDGESVATTMGFTALDGLVMGTRCGALDPGVVLHLLRRENMDASELERTLYARSGLLGVSGISSDMRTLLASEDPRAREAIDLFVYRIGRELGSLAASLNGIDALVFTGGIGEHAAAIRARVCRDANWLGLALDAPANARHATCISPNDARASAWVIPTDENLMVARHVQRVLDERQRDGP